MVCMCLGCCVQGILGLQVGWNVWNRDQMELYIGIKVLDGYNFPWA